MNRRSGLLARSILVLALLSSVPLAALEAPLPRHPAPSPDGTLIAFSWQGDIWLVASEGGQARRLTAHPADERSPVWSHDGRWIAFSSDRYGNTDVFVMPVDAGEPPRRLSYASEDDTPLDFSADNRAVLFLSGRAESVRWMNGLYSVPLAGGTPVLVQDALARWAALSPDGSSLAFVRGSTKWYRRGYRGSANRELWLRTASGEYRQLTDFNGDDDYPSWVDDQILSFQSSRAGRKNVFLLDITSLAVTQLTHYEGSAARAPRAAANGSFIAYEYEDAIWTVPVAGGTPQRLHIEVPAGFQHNPVERHSEERDADELAISPDGTVAAFVVHGEVFVTAIMDKEDQQIAKPPTQRVTRTVEQEKDISWSPDGSALLLTSAANGSEDLMLARPADPEAGWTESFEFSLTRLTDSPARERAGRFSPDGKRIAFISGHGDLVVMDADGGNRRVLLEHWDEPVFDWSPDGEWLAYSVNDLEFNTDVWIISAGGGTPYNLSRHPDDDLAPRWSPDGRRLVWQSFRHGDTSDVWGVWLTRADHERTPAEWLKLFKEEDKRKGKHNGNGNGEDGAKDEKKEDKVQPELPHVSIDFAELWRRTTPLTSERGDEDGAVLTPDGRTLLYTSDHQGERDLYGFAWGADLAKRLTSGGQDPSSLQLDREGKTVFYLDGSGTIKRIDLDGKAGDAIPFTARYETDVAEQRRAILDAAWRALDERFYDPQFHGIDWVAQRERYGPWALAASHEQDYADMFNLMIGELNASHMGYYPKQLNGGEKTGWIGAVVDAGAGGPGLLISEVLDGSPAATVAANLQPGERILAVNGERIGPDTNLYALLADTVDRRVPLTVAGSDGGERRVVVVPIDFKALERLRYEQWVRQRRALVEELAGGRLGYLHIEAMSMPSFEEFERDLYAAAHGKEGLIIDVRSNGGGWTTDMLMAVLDVRRHAYTVPRGADPASRAYPQGRLPLAAWTRPALTICNEESYSNAEIFSHAFKEIGRGLLVGEQTFGAVISTDATFMLNGARVRLPFRGWYVAGSGMNMENNGAMPDIVVRQPPQEDCSADQDSQLRRSVEVFLERLEQDPRHGTW